VVPRRVLENMQVQRALHLPMETGGFLLGLRRGRHLEVTEHTTEQKGDISTHFSFTRSSDLHAERTRSAWRQSEGYVGLVGDWHSHPVGDGAFSTTDTRAWTALCKATSHWVVGIIVGDQGHYKAFQIYPGVTRPRINELTIFEETETDLCFSIHGI